MKNEIKVIRNYSFWQHPLKWWRQRKTISLLNILINQKWEAGLKEEMEKMQEDMFFYGTAVMDKDGKRVNPTNLTPPNKKKN